MRNGDWHKLTRSLNPIRDPMTEHEASVIERHKELKTPAFIVALVLHRTMNWTIRAYRRIERTGSAMP